MNAVQLLLETLQLGISLRLRGEDIAASPPGKLPPDIRDRIRAAKPAIARLLADPQRLREVAAQVWEETVETVSKHWVVAAAEAASRGEEAPWLNQAQDDRLQADVGEVLKVVQDGDSLGKAREAMEAWRAAWEGLLAQAAAPGTLRGGGIHP